MTATQISRIENLADQELDADEEPTRSTEAELETDADGNNDDSKFLLASRVATVIEIAVTEACEEAINGTKNHMIESVFERVKRK